MCERTFAYACEKNKLKCMHVAMASVAKFGQIAQQMRCSKGCQIGQDMWHNLATLAVGTRGLEGVKGLSREATDASETLSILSSSQDRGKTLHMAWPANHVNKQGES